MLSLTLSIIKAFNAEVIYVYKLFFAQCYYNIVPF